VQPPGKLAGKRSFGAMLDRVSRTTLSVWRFGCRASSDACARSPCVRSLDPTGLRAGSELLQRDDKPDHDAAHPGAAPNPHSPGGPSETRPSDNMRRFYRASLMPSSCNCRGSTGPGAPVIRSVARWVLGKAIVSRMLSSPPKSITSRSIPRAMPPRSPAGRTPVAGAAGHEYGSFRRRPPSR